MSACRVICRRADGGLYDLGEDRRVEVDELREQVRAGRRFRAYQQETGTDCTYLVLVEILISSLPGCGLAAGAEPGRGLFDALFTQMTAEDRAVPPLGRSRTAR
ncbi:MAG: hypothetical protein M3O70_07595 [Actinomycetota bacterium]|nr:hypothetical protein [Actinomycetota bacterium]